MSGLFSTGQVINFKQWRLAIERNLGSGAFGTVFLVKNLNERRSLALKTIECRTRSFPHRVLREAVTLSVVCHERIVQMLDSGQYTSSNRTFFVILTEFCAGGDLNSRLNSSSSNQTNLKWIRQISEGLRYLHSRRPAIVHRDLKADNILLTDPVTEDLKIGDFGLAREYEALKNVGNSAEEIQTYYMNSGIGPVHWMAPEFFANHYTEKADIFSLGGIFYGIFSRDYITMGSKKMYGVFVSDGGWSAQKVGLGFAMANIDRNAKEEPLQVPDSLKSLIRGMLEYDPRNRPDAGKVEQRVNLI